MRAKRFISLAMAIVFAASTAFSAFAADTKINTVRLTFSYGKAPASGDDIGDISVSSSGTGYSVESAEYTNADDKDTWTVEMCIRDRALIKGTAADRRGNISFDDMFMSGDALSICQAVKANHGKVIVQVDRLVNTPSRPRNAIIPGCLVDAIVVVEPRCV